VGKYWAKKDMNSAVNAISMAKDQSVVIDILGATFAENVKVETLSLDQVN